MGSLPSRQEEEADIAAAVTGILEHEPPTFVYHPVVVSGVAVAKPDLARRTEIHVQKEQCENQLEGLHPISSI